MFFIKANIEAISGEIKSGTSVEEKPSLLESAFLVLAHRLLIVGLAIR